MEEIKEESQPANLTPCNNNNSQSWNSRLSCRLMILGLILIQFVCGWREPRCPHPPHSSSFNLCNPFWFSVNNCIFFSFHVLPSFSQHKLIKHRSFSFISTSFRCNFVHQKKRKRKEAFLLDHYHCVSNYLYLFLKRRIFFGGSSILHRLSKNGNSFSIWAFSRHFVIWALPLFPSL